MAAEPDTTPLPRRLPRAPTSGAPGARALRRRQRQRETLEAILDRALALLDALDGDPDGEPDDDAEAEPGEASGQPVTLAPDLMPARVLRFRPRVQS